MATQESPASPAAPEEAPLTPATSTKPSTVSLPLTFVNSFWTQDYRSGFSTLYAELDAGIVESNEVLESIKMRAGAERAMASALLPPALLSTGFARNEGGSSLRMGFEQILTLSVQESRARSGLADELIKAIAHPFSEWSQQHKGRIQSSKLLVESHLAAYEKKLNDVQKLKLHYDEACRMADSAEDELTFLKGAQSPTSPTKSESALESVDDDDVPLGGRVRAAGGSIVALGRALTTRRPSNTGNSGGKELPKAPFPPEAQAALDWSKNTFNTLIERVAGPQSGEGKNEKARKDADLAEEKYKDTVESLDELRLMLEETLHEHYIYTFRCESDRLKAATSVLRSFHSSISGLPKLLSGANEKVTADLQLLRPERDATATIERSRTGPFQPRPTVYHSHYSEPAVHTFGLDLRKWEETNLSPENKVPSILTFFLGHISDQYEKVEDAERRKAWLYETPLAAQHHLRAALNNPADLDRDIVEKYDLPVVVSTLKLWLLELDVPLIPFTHYDEYRDLYPKRVGAEIIEVPAKAIASHIARLPPVHVETLHAVIKHLVQLLASTKTEESDEIFLQKLSLSFARCIMRPKQETSLTLDDRFPALLLIDLIKSHQVIFESADQLKTKQREDRYKPRRQRTKPIDARLLRSNIGSSPPPPVPSHSSNSSSALPHLPSQSPSSPVSPAVAVPLASGISPSSSSGSLTRTEGRVRGARGPRPLPGSVPEASTPTAPSAPTETPAEQTFEPSAPPAEEAIVEEPESFHEAQE